MFLTPTSQTIKLIDFGLSVKWKVDAGKELRQSKAVGSVRVDGFRFTTWLRRCWKGSIVRNVICGVWVLCCLCWCLHVFPLMAKMKYPLLNALKH